MSLLPVRHRGGRHYPHTTFLFSARCREIIVGLQHQSRQPPVVAYFQNFTRLRIAAILGGEVSDSISDLTPLETPVTQ